MHRSRLCAVVIDCNDSTDIETAARFWSAALGRGLAAPEPESPTYRGLDTRHDEPMMMVQAVDHESRVHIDIETDDVEAEAARLEKLGATKIAKVKTWWVMRAPTGQRFCVVRPQSGTLDERGNQWP